MQVGNLVTSDVMAFVSRVLVDGVERPHASWSVDRSFSGGLPAQVAGWSGINQATASVDWASEDDVSEGGLNPWNRSTGWVPVKGAKVEIFAGDGTTEWKQFTGVVDKTTGSVGGGFQSSCIDGYDRLSAGVSHDALLRIMPPLNDGGEYRGVGLVSTYYVDLAMRAGGFYCTPMQEPSAVLFVPCQGGMWPHAGTVQDAVALVSSPEIRHAENRPAPWGFSVCNFNVTYLPRYTQPASEPLQLSAMVAPDSAGTFLLTVNYGASNFAQVAVTSGRTVIARINGTEICRLFLGEATVFSVLYKGGLVSIRTSAGETISGAGTLAGGSTTTIVTSGAVEARVAGIQVNHPTEAYMEHRPSYFMPSAVIGTGYVGHLGTLGAAKAIKDTTAVELIEEISEATLSAMWIDETGVLRWQPSIWLRSQNTMQTVTTLDDITSLGWEDSLLGSSSKVTVKWLDLALSTGRYQNVLVYEGSSQTLGSNETLEEIISPPAEEDWIMVDDSATRIGHESWANYNSKKGSFVGIDYVSNGTSVAQGSLPFVAITLDKIGPDAWKLVHSVGGALPANTEVTIATSATNTALFSHNRNKGLPRISAGAKAMWTDKELTPTGPAGVGPELVHECGVWVQDVIAANLASYLQSETVNPRPVITDLGVVYDPRRQLGDKIAISSPNLMGVELQALVTGMSNSAGSGGFEQSLTVVITDASTTYTTYEQFNAEGGTLTYAQWQALGPLPETYTQFNSSQGA